MNYQRAVKIGLGVVALATVWCCLGQCGQGRITDAFAMVDAGIRAAQKEEERCNQDFYLTLSSHVAAYPTPQNQKRLDGFPPLQQMERRYYFFLDSLRKQLLVAAGLSDNQPLMSQAIKADQQVVRQVLLAGQPNAVMQMAARTSMLRTAMLALTEYENSVAVCLPVDFTATPDGKYKLQGDAGNFYDLPLAGALAILSNLQAAATAGMTTVLAYCEASVGGRGIRCFEFMLLPAVSVRASYVVAGEPYEADIFLSSYSTGVENLAVKINGKSFPVKEGIAHYEVRALGVGQRSFLVDITGIKVYENGRRFYRDTFRLTKEFAYEVGTGHAQIYKPSSLYYLYTGVENPIAISIWDGPVVNNIQVVATGATLKNRGGGYYTLTPSSLRPVTLEVGAVKFKYQVRSLPDPLALLAGQSSGHSIGREMLLPQTALSTRFPEDFDFQADCSILDFHLTRFRPREDPEEADNQGGNFNQKVRQLLEKTLPGDRLLLDDIHVKCPGDQRPRTIGALALRIK